MVLPVDSIVPPIPRAGLARPMQAAIAWTEFLHGARDARAALSAVAELMEADVGLLLRLGGTGARQRRICTHDPLGDRLLARAAFAGLGADLFALPVASLRAGSVWAFAELDGDRAERISPRLLRWMEDRRIAEVHSLVLGARGGDCDVLELHFTRRLTARDAGLLAELAEVLAAAWARRKSGVVSRLVGAAQHDAKVVAFGTREDDILSTDNPLQLTRSEYRICRLLREGSGIQSIAADLRITESTMRSHLRSIYAKAGVTGQMGLLHMLLSRADAADRAQAT